MTRLAGRDNYKVVVSHYFDYEIFVQGLNEENARELATQRYPDHRILSIEKYNYWEV